MVAKSDKPLVALAAILFISLGIIVLSTYHSVERRANAQAAFDHSNCQYPDRTTNPADGCDNSDPCDPASAAKGGSGDCSDTAPALVQPTITEPPVTNTPDYSSKNNCMEVN